MPIDPYDASPGLESERPLVVSLCGTYLKREMQSLYRQIANLERFRTVVFTEQTANLEEFPHDPIVTLEKRTRPRYRGNFLLRLWFKHIVKQWPPPVKIGHVGRDGEYYHPYDLVERLREWRPALVHVYYGHKAAKYLPMLEDAGIPWIVSFHGVDVIKIVEEVGEAGLKRVFASAGLVLARSQSLLDRLKSMGCPEEKLRLNRTPVPIDSIPFAVRSGPADGRWRLLQACRLIPKKGLYTTLRALPKVVEQWPGTKWILAGSGPEEEPFRKAVLAAGMQEHVEMLGWVDQERLAAELAKAHLFLHPSELTATQDQEGVPNSMVEAMAAGLPVVATTHGGIPEAVTSGEDGLLVGEKDSDALAGALLRIMGDPALMETFSSKAHERVQSKFGFSACLGALEDAYQEAIDRSSDRSLPVVAS